MKTKNIIPIICGCIAILTCIGFAANFNDNVTENGLAVAILTTSLPFGALAACIYFIWKGTK